MRNPRYIDIHTHPDLKTFLSANRQTRRVSCVRRVRLPLILKMIDFALLGSIAGSQCALRQLKRRRGTIAFAGLYAFEKAMIQAGIDLGCGIRLDVITLARILKLMGSRRILNRKLVERISDEQYPYFDLFKEMQTHLEVSGLNRRPYKLLKNINDYDHCKLNVILTIEGGHNLMNSVTSNNAGNEALQNLGALKTGNSRYLFLALAHLQHNILCTHSWGMKIINDNRFIPQGSGITAAGYDIIKEALRQPDRILIDIKHMSLESRKQYYQYLRNNGLNIPIIISHGGVTGRSYNNMPVISSTPQANPPCTVVQYYQPRGLMDTYFNPWSINLYDEEITEIINSGGLIGLNLDERILGTKQKKADELIEYFSRTERNPNSFVVDANAPSMPQFIPSQFENELASFAQNLKNYLIAIIQHYNDFHNYDYQLGALTEDFERLIILWRRRISEELIQQNDIKHLCNYILHIVKIGGPQAWKHICIGSDFDGFINAIEGCVNATRYRCLRRGLIKWLPRMAAVSPVPIPVTDIRRKVNDIMGGNVNEFLKLHFV